MPYSIPHAPIHIRFCGRSAVYNFGGAFFFTYDLRDCFTSFVIPYSFLASLILVYIVIVCASATSLATRVRVETRTRGLELSISVL